MENEKSLRVLEAAKAVFLRYGFRRVTMQDIAAEAGISRPALYLIYPNKEEVFKAAARQIAKESLAAIRAGLAHQATVNAQLHFAFEVWSIETFKMMLSSPDARDVIECAQGFARETVRAIDSEFETVLVEILRPLTRGKPPVLPASQIAHLLASSAHGYKEMSTTVEQLRTMIAGLITLTLAALEPRADHKKTKHKK
jgi:AcrR family transcriptional regulator